MKKKTRFTIKKRQIGDVFETQRSINPFQVKLQDISTQRLAISCVRKTHYYEVATNYSTQSWEHSLVCRGDNSLGVMEWFYTNRAVAI